MRRNFEVSDLDPNGAYHLMTATVLPRPIAWVSTVSAEGVDNLAPHSFFTVAAADPPVVQFTSIGSKDTLRNVLATKEFVVCFTPEPLFEKVNDTSIDFPAHLSEFDEIGLTREDSLRVAPKRVAESPVAFECTLNRTIEIGNSTVVMGDVVNFSIDESVLDLSDPRRPHPRVEDLMPLARLGKNQWSTLGSVLDEPRKKYSDIKHDKK